MLCNLLTLQCIVREGLNRNTQVVSTRNVVPSKGHTSGRGHETTRSRGVDQQNVVATDKAVALSDTLNRIILDCFHHVEVLDFKDFCQLRVSHQGSISDSSTTVEAIQNIRVVNQSVTNFFTDNHRVRLKATRLKLNGTTQASNVLNRGRVGVVIPVGDFSSSVVITVSNTVPVSTPDTISEEGGGELVFTMDQQTVNQSGRTCRANVQSGIFIGKRLLVKVHTEAIHISKIRVIRNAHTDAVDFSARSKFFNVAFAAHVVAVVDVVLVRLTLNANQREHLVRDKVFLRLYISQRQVCERLVNMHLTRSQKRHNIYPLFLVRPQRCRPE